MSQIRDFFRNADVTAKLIIANAIVFVALQLFHTILFFSGADVRLVQYYMDRYLALPASLHNLAGQPWTILTFMFVHYEFMHIFFNMLWLYFFGRMIEEYLGGKKLWATYVLGSLCGGVLYIIAFNILPVFAPLAPGAYAIGASAGIMAIVVGAATLLPNQRIMMIFIPVELKYVAAFYVVMDLLNIAHENPGGNIAHVGGALFGFLYVYNLKRGRDIASWFSNFSGSFMKLFTGRGKMKVVYKEAGPRKKPISDEQFNTDKKARQEVVDKILDKISKSGYDSLSKEEKDILFRASKD